MSPSASNLRVNHVGISVSDLDRSTEFYLSLGGRLVVDSEFDGSPALDALHGLKDVQQRLRHILVGSTIVELLHFQRPLGDPFSARNCDIGASHIGFQVDDIWAVYKSMSTRGIEFLSPPMSIEAGPFAGTICVFCRDPDGIPVEIVQVGPKFAAVIAGTLHSFDDDHDV